MKQRMTRKEHDRKRWNGIVEWLFKVKFDLCILVFIFSFSFRELNISGDKSIVGDAIEWNEWKVLDSSQFFVHIL